MVASTTGQSRTERACSLDKKRSDDRGDFVRKFLMEGQFALGQSLDLIATSTGIHYQKTRVAPSEIVGSIRPRGQTLSNRRRLEAMQQCNDSELGNFVSVLTGRCVTPSLPDLEEGSMIALPIVAPQEPIT